LGGSRRRPGQCPWESDRDAWGLRRRSRLALTTGPPSLLRLVRVRPVGLGEARFRGGRLRVRDRLERCEGVRVAAGAVGRVTRSASPAHLQVVGRLTAGGTFHEFWEREEEEDVAALFAPAVDAVPRQRHLGHLSLQQPAHVGFREMQSRRDSPDGVVLPEY
jgi:hypothetical protein